MNEQELLKKMKQSAENAPPDVIEDVIADIKAGRFNESESIDFEQIKAEGKDKRSLKRFFASAGVCAAAVLALMIGLRMNMNAKTIAASVNIDVNPSVELKLNASRKVIEADALNDDGRGILSDLELKGTGLDTALNAIIGKMLKLGYVNEIANSILVSVKDAENTAEGKALERQITDDIGKALESYSVNASVLSQSIAQNDENKTLAESYGISEGKTELIKQVIAKNPVYDFKSLAGLSIHELNLLLNPESSSSQSVTSSGNASEKAYIGREKAKAVALSHAKLSEKNTTDMDVEYDYENGVLIYEVEFNSGGYEYDYDIDAVTGKIIRSNKKADDDYSEPQGQTNPNASTSTTGYISAAKAKQLALNKANVSESKISRYSIDFDKSDKEYEIEFFVGNVSYEIEIDAVSGNVKSYDKETEEDDDEDYDDDHVVNKGTSSSKAASASANPSASGND